MPNALENLERGAFWECRKLKFLTLPSKVKEIGAVHFWYCDSLESITMLSPTLPKAGNLFEKDKKQRVILRVPRKHAAVYRNSVKWSTFEIEEFN